MNKKRAKRDTYPYKLKDGNKIVYIGQTKEPERREEEHRAEGKKFTRMDREFPCSEETALKKEQEEISRYRRSHGGRGPKYNK